MTTTASTRTSTNAPAEARASRETALGTQPGAVRELAVHATRIQLASLTTLSRFFSGWAQSSDRYLHAVSDELAGRVHGQTAANELVGRLAAVSRLHLRELTALPTDTANHFKNELAKGATPGKRPRPTSDPAR